MESRAGLPWTPHQYGEAVPSSAADVVNLRASVQDFYESMRKVTGS
jgi:hypothetical protein